MLPNKASAVILATNYNPTIASKDWLFEKQVLTDEIKSFLHSPALSVVDGDEVGFALEPSRLQFTVKKITDRNLSGLSTSLLNFVRALPETPFKAVGFNFDYVIPKQRVRLERLIVPNDSELRRLLGGDYEIGAMLLFAFGPFMTSLGITGVPGESDQVRIAFNFHSEASGFLQVEARLVEYQKTLEKAVSIVGGILDA